MAQLRFKQLDTDSFFGAMVYDRVVPRHHFLHKLDEVVPWQRVTDEAGGL